MKKTKLIPIAAISLMISLVSCNWQIPENVSVKTQAEYEFVVGRINKSLDDFLNLQKMIGDSLPEDKGMAIYDYNPGKKDPFTQRYLMKIPIAEIPLDLNSFMEEINLEENLKAMEFHKEIEVPNVSIPEVGTPITFANVPTIPEGMAINVPTVNQSVKLANGIPESSPVESCVIKEGYINVDVTGLNSDATIEASLSSDGGLTLGSTNCVDKKISIKGATLKKGESTISLAITLGNVKSLNNPQVKLNPVITSLESITVDLGDTMKTSFTNEQGLPKEVSDTVTSIKLLPSGLNVTYTNMLPEGNDIKIKAKSNFLNLAENIVTLRKGTNIEDKELFKGAGGNIEISPGTKIDSTVEIVLPGQDGTKITVNNVEVGKKYSIGMKLEPVLDWESVQLKPNALKEFKKTNIEDLKIDLNGMLTDLGKTFGDENLAKKLSVKELPVYLFCTKPKDVSAFEQLKFNGTAKLIVDDGKTAPTVIGYLLGNNDSGVEASGEMVPVDTVPELNIENSNCITKDFSTLVEGVDVSLKPKGLAETAEKIISTPGSLKVQYDISATGVTDTSAIVIQKSELSGVTKIAIEAYLDLGMAFKVKEDIVVDFVKIFGIDPADDLLNGNLAMIKEEGIDKYLAAIKEISLDYNLRTLPYHSENDAKINLKFGGLDNMAIGLSKGKVGITKDQISKLINSDKPEFKIENFNITIPQGSFSVPRDKTVDSGVMIRIATDGTIQLK